MADAKQKKSSSKPSDLDMLALLNATQQGSNTTPKGSVGNDLLNSVLGDLDSLASQKPDAAPMIAKMKSDLRREFARPNKGVVSGAGNQASAPELPPSMTAPPPPLPARQQMAVPGGA